MAAPAGDNNRVRHLAAPLYQKLDQVGQSRHLHAGINRGLRVLVSKKQHIKLKVAELIAEKTTKLCEKQGIAEYSAKR